MIEIKELSFAYRHKNVLNNISLNIENGTLNMLLGLNGAGKTTFFKCLLKLEKLTNGDIVIDGVSIKDLSASSLAKRVSFVAQINDIVFTDVYVRDYIVESRTPYLKNISTPNKDDYLLVEKYAKKVGIDNLLNRELTTLSGGELQLVLITRALVQETPIIVMDEPTSSLDLVNQAKILETIKLLHEEGKTVIISTHNPNHALLLNANVILLHDNILVEYGRATTVLSEANIKKVYGDIVKLTSDNSDNKSFQINITKDF